MSEDLLVLHFKAPGPGGPHVIRVDSEGKVHTFSPTQIEVVENNIQARFEKIVTGMADPEQATELKDQNVVLNTDVTVEEIREDFLGQHITLRPDGGKRFVFPRVAEMQCEDRVRCILTVGDIIDQSTDANKPTPEFFELEAAWLIASEVMIEHGLTTQDFGFGLWTQVPPEMVYQRATDEGFVDELPQTYQEAAKRRLRETPEYEDTRR